MLQNWGEWLKFARVGQRKNDLVIIPNRKNMKKIHSGLLLTAILVLLTAALRVLNAEMHWYHLIPLSALGIFSGSVLEDKRWAYLIPLSAFFLSDLGLALFTHQQGFYGVSQIVNYSALALVTFLGTRLQRRNVLNIGLFTVSGSLIYFLLSNLGTYLGGYYGYSWGSLVECFTMAIPFYKSELATQFFSNSLFGDLAFSFLAFAVWGLYKVRQTNSRLA